MELSDLMNLKELTIQGMLLVGLVLVYRDGRRREKSLQEKLDKKDTFVFKVLDKTSLILDKVEDMDAKRTIRKERRR